MNVDEMLDLMEETLEEGTAVPFAPSKRMVDVDRMRDIIDEVRSNLPDEIRESKKIVRDREDILKNARAESEQIIKQAEAYRESKINEAEGQAARFTELFAEYQNYPLITKQRLFYEAMEEILPEVKLYIVDEQTGVQTALPLEQFATVNAGTAEGGASN